jgi:hypothetical protein
MIEWLVANWVVPYLLVGIFAAAHAAQDGSRSGTLAYAATGLTWPLYLVAVIFTLIARG